MTKALKAEPAVAIGVVMVVLAKAWTKARKSRKTTTILANAKINHNKFSRCFSQRNEKFRRYWLLVIVIS